MSNDNKAIARKLIEDVWNDRKLNFLDEVIDASYTYHDPNSPDFGQGPQNYKARVTLYANAFPDMRLAIEEVVAEGDSVVLRWQASGTHKGELYGIAPTGKTVGGPGMSILHFRNGKVVEDWAVWDTLGLLRQLGVVPATVLGQAA